MASPFLTSAQLRGSMSSLQSCTPLVSEAGGSPPGVLEKERTVNPTMLVLRYAIGVHQTNTEVITLWSCLTIPSFLKRITDFHPFY